MTREEAMAWLTGERSAWNQHYGMGNDTRNAMASCAVEDAARTEQAYWTMRADSEGLIPANASHHAEATADSVNGVVGTPNRKESYNEV